MKSIAVLSTLFLVAVFAVPASGQMDQTDVPCNDDPPQVVLVCGQKCEPQWETQPDGSLESTPTCVNGTADDPGSTTCTSNGSVCEESGGVARCVFV